MAGSAHDELASAHYIVKFVFESVAEHEDVANEPEKRFSQCGRGFEGKSEGAEIIDLDRASISERKAEVVCGGGAFEEVVVGVFFDCLAYPVC